MVDDAEAEEIAKRDELNARAFAFWRAKTSNAWPHSSIDFTFMGDAVHTLGASLYGEEWNHNIPAEAHLPVLGTSRRVVVNGFDAVFAHLILTGENLFDQFRASRRQWISPVTDEGWLMAHETYLAAYAGRLERSRLMYNTVARAIVEAAAQATLSLATISFEGRPHFSAPSDWVGGISYARIQECQMNPEPGGEHEQIELKLLIKGHRYPPLMRSHEWLFVTTESLNVFLKARRRTELPPGEITSKSISDSTLERALDLIAKMVTDNHWYKLGSTAVVDLMYAAIPGLARDHARDFVKRTDKWPKGWEKKQGNRPNREKAGRDMQAKKLREKLCEEFGGNFRH